MGINIPYVKSSEIYKLIFKNLTGKQIIDCQAKDNSNKKQESEKILLKKTWDCSLDNISSYFMHDL